MTNGGRQHVTKPEKATAPKRPTAQKDAEGDKRPSATAKRDEIRRPATGEGRAFRSALAQPFMSKGDFAGCSGPPSPLPTV